MSSPLRRCTDDERADILEIVNAAAEAYRGVIPPDQWHEPYMDAAALEREIAAGVIFFGCDSGGRLAGVMGLQVVASATYLIRHAYVRPEHQGEGIGRRLLEHLVPEKLDITVLVGTWAAAEWAIRFYERNGFQTVGEEEKNRLLRTYWSISERQVETSVVLAHRPAARRKHD